MEELICDYISQSLVHNPSLLPLANDAPLIESGILDSLSLLRLLVFLEEQFNMRMDDVEFRLENFGTIDAICAHVRAHQSQET